MAGRYSDLDDFLGEVKDESLNVRLLGRYWELPGDPPADLIITAQRARQVLIDLNRLKKEKGDDAEIPADLREELAAIENFNFQKALRDLVGQDNYDQMVKGLSYRKLQAVFWKLVNLYEGGADDSESEREGDESEGEPEADGQKKGRSPGRKSSRTGKSSRRGSSANTG